MHLRLFGLGYYPTYTPLIGEGARGQLLYHGQTATPFNRKVDIIIDVPNVITEQPNLLPLNTDASGAYSIMPFAGYQTGTYKVSVAAKFAVTPTLTVIIRNSTTLDVEAVTPILDMRSQSATVQALYRARIPDGPIRTSQDEFSRAARLADPESLYGIDENMFLAGTSVDPKKDFVCGGYTSKVLAFFDGLRFNSDPAKRALLKGLDYGPLQRGWPGPGQWITGHYAVVLYPIGSEWSSASSHSGQWAQVFDPWPTQRAAVTTLSEFSGGFGFIRPAQVYVSFSPKNVFDMGYPLCGGVIYINPNMKNSTKTEGSGDPNVNLKVDCPVDVVVTDSRGRRAGVLPNGTMVLEFPAYAERAQLSNGTPVWYFGLGGDSYTVDVVGLATGSFRAQVSGGALNNSVLDYGQQPIATGTHASITLEASNPNPTMTLPSGDTVIPQAYLLPSGTNSPGDQSKPSFVFSGLVISPSSVEVGEIVQIGANVTNTGQIGGSFNVIFNVNYQIVGNTMRARSR